MVTQVKIVRDYFTDNFSEKAKLLNFIFILSTVFK